MTRQALKIFASLLLLVSLQAQDGTVDETFALDGHTLTEIIEDKNSAATDVIVLEDGKILASGTFDNFGRPGLVVVRYNPDGSLDESFGEGGIATTFFSETQVEGTPSAMAVQSDGKIILSGASTSQTDFDLALARLNADGSVDSSFGTNGGILTPVGDSHDHSNDMVLQEDDKIILAGSTSGDNGTDAIVVRFTPDGQLDNTFGNGGIVITDFEGGADVFNTVELQSNGKIVAGGYSSYFGFSFAVAKYNSDGSLDTSFDQDGLLFIDGLKEWIVSITLLNEHQIMVLGTDGGSDVQLARLNSDGSLDTAFGNNGTLVTTFVNSTNDGPTELLVQNDNKFVVVGTTWQSGPWVMSGQRFNADGTVDNSFADNGAFFINLNEQDFSRANGATLAEDGSIFIAGRTLTDKRIGIFTVLKINNSTGPLVGVEKEEELTKGFSLAQNYPNPFNPSTTIKFSIPETGFVSLKVFDILGKVVIELVNEELNAGSYSATFNTTDVGKNLASGIYFYRLEAGQFSQTKKLMLIK